MSCPARSCSARAGVPGFPRAASSTRSSTCSARDVSGRPCRARLRPVRRSGRGSRPTRRSTRPRWLGEKTGPNPTDRAKSGTKRHILTDGGGVPIAITITGANTPDMEGIRELLDARIVWPAAGTEQHLCLDKGYDYVVVERAVRQRRFQPHIRPGGEEQRACRRGTRARRWVVERTHSWFNRYRKLLIRWEKKPQNYLALVQFAAVLIVWRLVG